MNEQEMRRLVELAKEGDRAALDGLVTALQARIYGLAIRMLADPRDAEDATQEILIKVVTNLAAFRGESAFATWAHRVAANHLLTTRRRRAEQSELSFETMGHVVERAIASPAPEQPDGPETAALLSEVRINCTLGMLLCLDREHRLAYLLAEVFDLNGEEGAQILDITPDNFRKRLSRAREALLTFMKSRCGVYDAANPCRCSRMAPIAIGAGMIDPAKLRFANHPVLPEGQLNQAEVLEVLGLFDAKLIYQSHPNYAPPEVLVGKLRALLQSTLKN